MEPVPLPTLTKFDALLEKKAITPQEQKNTRNGSDIFWISVENIHSRQMGPNKSACLS